MEEHIIMFAKKVEILACHINKHIEQYEVENKELLSTTQTQDKSSIKNFLAKSIAQKDNFRKQSTKMFYVDHYLYEGIHRVWSHLVDTDKAVIWNLLYEIFMLSIQIFPILKNTDYTFLSVYLTLEKKTDISLPTLPLLTILSTLVKEAFAHITRELEEGKISKNMLEHLFEEFKLEGVASLQQMGALKEKCKDLMEKPEVKYIIDITKLYFTESMVERIHAECKRVFEGTQFQTFTKQYTKDKLLSMFQKQEFTFSNIRQMVVDSGIMELLGEDFEIPLNFEECTKMIKKYTDKDFQGTDIKTFFEENIAGLSEIPQLKSLIKKSGFQHILDPIMKMFSKTDHKEETLKRKMKRRKKELKKLNNQD
jgi:hypothetical protein